jgi:hypothetical protein
MELELRREINYTWPDCNRSIPMTLGAPRPRGKTRTRDENVAIATKVGAAVAVLVVLLLSVLWFRARYEPDMLRLRSAHTVTLSWKASSSPVAGYNVYRSTSPTGNYVRINSTLVQGTTFTDRYVQSGSTYYYVTRAVDGLGRESINSNEARATIP